MIEEVAILIMKRIGRYLLLNHAGEDCYLREFVEEKINNG